MKWLKSKIKFNNIVILQYYNIKKQQYCNIVVFFVLKMLLHEQLILRYC